MHIKMFGQMSSTVWLQCLIILQKVGYDPRKGEKATTILQTELQFQTTKGTPTTHRKATKNETRQSY
jgi:hypothetical protein